LLLLVLPKVILILVIFHHILLPLSVKFCLPSLRYNQNMDSSLKI